MNITGFRALELKGFIAFKKGRKFTLEEIGTGKLFVHRSKSPFIYIKGKESYVIINSSDPDVTVLWYEQIREELD